MTNEKFEEMVRQYERLVYTVCCQLVHNADAAQDLAQDTFAAAYIHRDECPPESYKPWLARIAANKAKDYLKSAYYRKNISVENSELPERADPALLPDEEAADREAAQRIRACILALPEPYYLVSKMFFIEQRSVEEIADALRRPRKTVHSQLARAKVKLREQLERRNAT